VPGFGPSTRLVEHYSRATGDSVDPVRFAFHIGLAAWRAACIGAVVLARYQAGRSAGTPVDHTRGAAYVSHYLSTCNDAIEAYRGGGGWGPTR
jgi:hypothetical protein